MAFQFVAILALLACAQANYIPTDLPYGYGSTIAPAALTHGSILAGYSPAAHLVEPLARASHLQVQAPLLNGFINPAHLAIGGSLPEGKTTLTKTFVSTPTYVTSHVSNRVHTNEPKHVINSHAFGYDRNVINSVEAPLSYDAYYAGQNIPYGADYGHVY